MDLAARQEHNSVNVNALEEVAESRVKTDLAIYLNLPRIIIMTWTTPAAIDLRFGFEITMYIANR
jgi:pyrroloquinoline quinone biosynthesis protein A